jgi:hypothetical protein
VRGHLELLSEFKIRTDAHFTLNLATKQKTVFGQRPVWGMLRDQVVLEGEDATLNFRECRGRDAIRHHE